jgi:hypothetical protein
MKLQFTKTLLILGLLIGVGNVTARAQALSEGTIEADVPHSFVVRDTTLPAGKYTLRRLDNVEPQVIEIRSANGRTAVVFEAESAQANQIPRNAELVFDKIGDQYFLWQIWSSDSDLGYQLPKTKAQERLEGDGMKAEHHSIFAKFSKKHKKGKVERAA